jgi:hypothetical protein
MLATLVILRESSITVVLFIFIDIEFLESYFILHYLYFFNRQTQ